jgi:Subtilase family/Peptidase inhibitor I9
LRDFHPLEGFLISKPEELAMKNITHSRALLTVCLLLLSTPSLFAGEGRVRKSRNAIPDEYIVVLNDDVSDVSQVARLLGALHGGQERLVWRHALKGFSMRMSPVAAERLSRDPRVKFVEEDAMMELSASQPTDRNPETGAVDPGNPLWHLDRLDQDTPLLNKTFKYCSTGNAVRVYVVDTGILKSHKEFWVSDTNTSTPRVLPGYNANGSVPVGSPGYDPSPATFPCGRFATNNIEAYNGGHGTAVASAVGGRTVGNAKSVYLIPVKVLNCSAQGPTSITIDGLNWIVDPTRNPDAAIRPAVVTMSTFRDTINTPASEITALEAAVDGILNAQVNGVTKGIAVIASANNQGVDACRTSPARHSRNNPDPAVRGRVITAGGTMIVNDPYDASTADTINPTTRDARWICNSSNAFETCGTNLVGSNHGPCLTLFAPARKLTLATTFSNTSYRTIHKSGTSWSAPITAGVAARWLENPANYNDTPDDVHNALLFNTHRNIIDGATIGAGSPNRLLRTGDITINQHPFSTTIARGTCATLSVAATANTPPRYQWYQGTRGNPASTPILGATENSLTVCPSATTNYWCRVDSDCATADSNTATVTVQ